MKRTSRDDSHDSFSTALSSFEGSGPSLGTLDSSAIPPPPPFPPKTIESSSSVPMQSEPIPNFVPDAIFANPLNTTDTIPINFVEGCQHDMVLARRRWQITKKWRADNRVDAILSEAQPNFAMIKALYPHAIHKQGKSGHWIYIERPGYAKLDTVWRCGLSFADFERHYTFVTEYIWRMIDTREDGQIISVFDVENCTLNELAGKTLKMFKRCSALVGAHYPERSFKIFIINAPWYFSAAWGILSPFLDPRTRQKVQITRGNARKVLAQYCDADNLPPEIGGTDVTKFGDSPVEKKLRSLVERLNSKVGYPTRADFCIPEYGSTKNE